MNYYETIAKKAAELCMDTDAFLIATWFFMFAAGVLSAWIPAVICRCFDALVYKKEKP